MMDGRPSQHESKHLGSPFTFTSNPAMFAHPSPPPSAHGSVDHHLHIWALPPPQHPQQQDAPSSSSTTAPESPPIAVPPISSFHNFTPPSTAFTFGRANLPPHLRSDSDQVSVRTWITAANTDELAQDDDDDHEFEDTKFVYENGRRYHANAEGRILYPLPNDEPEQEREDMNHKLALLIMHDKLFYAPIEHSFQQHGGTVFDLGTGTGEWAMDLARKFGKTQVHGVDLSPIQPAYVWDNVFFSTGDFDDELTWTDHPENSFDLIHMRFTSFCIKDASVLLERAMRYLKPGGYIEFQEMVCWPHADDDTLTPGTPYAFRDFCHYMHDGLARLGLDQFTITRLPDLLRARGFADVTEVRHKLPIGRWARERRQREKGTWFLRMIIMEGLSGICKRAFMHGLGWKESQVEMFLVEVRRSLNHHDGTVHAYFPFAVVYAQKPVDGGGGDASFSATTTTSSGQEGAAGMAGTSNPVQHNMLA